MNPEQNPEQLANILAEHKKWVESDGTEGARAYLAGAYLARADLAGANLAGAYLAGADLAGAYLADANLAGADLAGANLAGAYLAGADLARADLADAQISTKSAYEVPVVPDLERSILASIDAGAGLDMLAWHTCETTHCMAGWTIHKAGPAGYELEKRVGAQRAGTLIYRASCNGFAPHFFASSERALKQLRERVADAV